MVVNELYYGVQDLPSPSCAAGRWPVVPHASTSPSKSSSPSTSSISISPDIIAAALHTIYSRDFDPQSNIEPNLFNAISSTLGQAVESGVMSSMGSDPLYEALRHSTDVFSAFKVHRAQNDMAARLLDSNGNLKPFEQWKEEVLPIADHQCSSWLETEYNTAVLRARQAANWQQFQREKDILPNLKWLPSTSPNPGADHRPFWNTILPIDHPFWDEHRPGDRWNCKCDLTSTDDPTTPVPSATVPDGSPSVDIPQKGLTSNPGKSGEVFSQDHPYFPSDCKQCAFYKPTIQARIRHTFIVRVKDCYNCPYIVGCIDRANAKKKIDDAAFKKKNEINELNLMPLPDKPNKHYGNLFTGTMHFSEKSKGRFLYHAHHDYDVVAAIYAWNHPEELRFIEQSELGEVKDMSNPKDVKNIIKKKKRGVKGYLIYSLSYDGKKYIVKTEKLKWGIEQLYSIIEE